MNGISDENLWLRMIPIIGNAITAVGIACVGLWRYYRLAQLDISERQRQIDIKGGG